MNIIFAGSSYISCLSLKELIKNDFNIVGVLTQPPKPGKKPNILEENPLLSLAKENNLNILTPQKLDTSFRECIKQLNPDILVCVSYGKIFGPKFLSLFPLGGINLHPSLLPLHRGCSPIQQTILSGDLITGVSIQKLALEMDSGDILLQKDYPLSGDETFSKLENDLGVIGASMLCHTLNNLNSITPAVQDSSKSSYCGMISKEDYKINPCDSYIDAYRKIRAYDGNSYLNIKQDNEERKLFIIDAKPIECDDMNLSNYSDGQIIKNDKKNGIILKFKDGFLAVSKLKLQFKKEMDNNSFFNGNRDIINSILY